MELLAILCSRKKCSGRELARFYKEETPSINFVRHQLSRLKEAEWVTIVEDSEEDGRVRYFITTAAGVKALSAAREPVHRPGLFFEPATGIAMNDTP